MNTNIEKIRNTESNFVYQLTDEELIVVGGGILPVIGFGLSLASHVGVGGAATTLTGHVISAVGLGLASYGLASYFGGGGRRWDKRNTASH
jgi:hypothetical protein